MSKNFSTLIEFWEKFPEFPIHINKKKTHITIYPEEVKIWKTKLLRYLNQGVIEENRWYLPGICGILFSTLRNNKLKLSEQINISKTVNKHFKSSFTTWPHYSGNIEFPIRDRTRSSSPEIYYHATALKKWINVDRKYRISLLNHWIKSMPKNGLRIKITGENNVHSNN